MLLASDGGSVSDSFSRVIVRSIEIKAEVVLRDERERGLRKVLNFGHTVGHALEAPWIAVFPGLAIAVTVFGISLFGDALRDALDPKLRGR